MLEVLQYLDTAPMAVVFIFYIWTSTNQKKKLIETHSKTSGAQLDLIEKLSDKLK